MIISIDDPLSSALKSGYCGKMLVLFYVLVIVLLSCHRILASNWPDYYQDGMSRESRPSSSSSRSSILDDILSRPALPRPERGQRADEGTRPTQDRGLSLSKHDVQAIYREHLGATATRRGGDGSNSSRQVTQANMEAVDAYNDDDYDFEEEIYGSDDGDEDEGQDMEGTEDGIAESMSTDRMTEGSENDFGYLAHTRTSKLPKWQADINKSLFEQAWRRRELSCKMKAQDLAIGVAQIKIDLYEYDIYATLGGLASNHVKRNAPKKYWSEYRFWARRYTSVLKHMEESIRSKETLKGVNLSLEERKRLLRKKVVNVKMKTYEDWKRKKCDPNINEVAAISRARRAGVMIQAAARRATGDSHLQIKDMSIEDIEFYSREFDTGLTGRKEESVSKESIKRFLKKVLLKNDDQVNEFSIRRLDWRLECIKLKRREKRLQEKSLERSGGIA